MSIICTILAISRLNYIIWLYDRTHCLWIVTYNRLIIKTIWTQNWSTVIRRRYSFSFMVLLVLILNLMTHSKTICLIIFFSLSTFIILARIFQIYAIGRVICHIWVTNRNWGRNTTLIWMIIWRSNNYMICLMIFYIICVVIWTRLSKIVIRLIFALISRAVLPIFFI